jgi:hypothetical protein
LNYLGGASAINFRSQFYNYTLISGNHVAAGEPVSPCLAGAGPCFIHLGVPDTLIAFGGCPQINDFDLIMPTGPGGQAEFINPSTGAVYIMSQTTPTASTVARVIGSGFSYHYIREKRPGFPMNRVEHLRDILIWMQNILPIPSAIDDTPMLTSLGNNYPNPFNPETAIAYSIAERASVSLRIYNVAGQLVRTLVDWEQTPRQEGFSVTWDGTNDVGAPVSSGVYFYRLVTKGFTETKKMVLLK